MNEYSQPGFGKISVHSDGMGAPTPELVEKRAREIALIDERDPEQFNDGDWDQARKELLGEGTTPVGPEDADAATDRVSAWDGVPGSTGGRAPRAGLEDDGTIG
nr:hypothetical protein [Chthoniobacterales bacterium]